MNQSAYDFLIQEKTRKSKLDNLSYTDLRTQSYLMSGNISTRKKKLIFKVRTRMVQVGDNFGKKEDLCRICLLELNTQIHLTQCSVLKVKYPEIFSNNHSNYMDIFGTTPDKQKDAIDLFEKCLRKRDQTAQ